MRFQRKKIRKQIEDVLNMYIETEKYPPEMINRILEIVKSEHIAKEHFRKQRDNAIIRYDYSKSNGSAFFYLGREVKEQETFKVEGTFESLYAAQSWARSKGYVYGSLCCDAPVALRKGQSFSEYDLPEKWKNMSDDDIKSIDGVIKSRDFRDGSVTVMLF